MAQRRPFNQTRRKGNGKGPIHAPIELPKPLPRFVPKQYGAPFVLLEDDQKKTYEYRGGAWVQYERSIAECKVDCQVKQLAQRVNNMTRYEIRLPLPAEA